jgi:hypothetical protein
LLESAFGPRELHAPNQGQHAIGQHQDPIEMYGRLFGVILSQFARSLTTEKPAMAHERENISEHIDRLESSIERLSNRVDGMNGQMSKLESQSKVESNDISNLITLSKLRNDQQELTQTIEDASSTIRQELSQAMDAKSKSIESELFRIEKHVSSCEIREVKDRDEVKRELAELKRSMPIRCCLESDIRIERISPDYRFRDNRRLDGIISWLTRANGGQNLQDAGLVRVITDVPCNGSYFGKNILDVCTNTCYLSQTSDVPGKWIGYDFGELIRILPTHYSL